MSEIINELKKAADNALNSSSLKEGMKHLAKAFALFSQESEKIQKSYSDLQNQYAKINQILLKRSNELETISIYLSNILKNISQGILFIDLNGTITTCNEAAEKILKKKKEDILYQSFYRFFDDHMFGFSLKDSLSMRLSTKTSFIKIKDKEIEISTCFVQDAPKNCQGMILLLKDITKIKHLQMVANRNDRMKELGEMAAAVAHEIRNPLGGIRGYATLIYQDLKNQPHLQSMVGHILEGTKSLELLVNQVLQFSRPVILNRIKVNFNSLIEKTIKLIKMDPSFPEKVEISFHYSEKDFEIFIDPEKMHSALINLIVNAYQAFDHQGKIVLSLLKQNDKALFIIEDNGKGIEKNDLEHIFSPFFTTKQKGNGLGLSEVYKIIQAHFGTIEARSEMNQGTVFTITLPIKEL